MAISDVLNWISTTRTKFTSCFRTNKLPLKKLIIRDSTLSSNIVIPDELIVVILSMLPVKTLLKMKCVNRSWYIIISDPTFVKLHLLQSSRKPRLALLPYWNPSENVVVPLTIRRLLLENPITTDYNSHYQLTNKDCIEVVGSCNGLLCLLGYVHGHSEHNLSFRFWNPATKTLSPKLGYMGFNPFDRTYDHYFYFAFGYDTLTDTYKVVAFSLKEVKVFSLGDNVWRRIQYFPVDPLDLPFEFQKSRCYVHVNKGVYLSGIINWSLISSNKGVYLNGTINWLAFQNKTKYEWNEISIGQTVIISLDLSTETYQQFLPPHGFVEVLPIEPSITALTDCLYFSHRFEGTYFVLWKMMEFGVQESWTQFLKISYIDLQMYYGISNVSKYNGQLFLLPLHLCESSNTLILASNYHVNPYIIRDGSAVLYNWKTNRLKKIIEKQDCVGDTHMHWFGAKDHVESLAWPC